MEPRLSKMTCCRFRTLCRQRACAIDEYRHVDRRRHRSTQAVVPDAKITITRAEPDHARSRTGAGGDTRGLLPPGQYDISVEKPGFLAQTKRYRADGRPSQPSASNWPSEPAARSWKSRPGSAPREERSQQANTLDAAAIRTCPSTAAIICPLRSSRGHLRLQSSADANSFSRQADARQRISFTEARARQIASPSTVGSQ